MTDKIIVKRIRTLIEKPTDSDSFKSDFYLWQRRITACEKAQGNLANTENKIHKFLKETYEKSGMAGVGEVLNPLLSSWDNRKYIVDPKTGDKKENSKYDGIIIKRTRALLQRISADADGKAQISISNHSSGAKVGMEVSAPKGQRATKKPKNNAKAIKAFEMAKTEILASDFLDDKQKAEIVASCDRHIKTLSESANVALGTNVRKTA